MNPEAKLKELGLALPPAPTPFANYRAAVRTGDLLVVAGQGPVRGKDILIQGRVPDTCSIPDAQQAARQATLNALSIVREEVGALSKVDQVVQCTVWVACTDDFQRQPTVADGATELLKQLWGHKGLPARAAVGTNALPMGIPVEVALTFQVHD